MFVLQSYVLHPQDVKTFTEIEEEWDQLQKEIQNIEPIPLNNSSSSEEEEGDDDRNSEFDEDKNGRRRDSSMTSNSEDGQERPWNDRKDPRFFLGRKNDKMSQFRPSESTVKAHSFGKTIQELRAIFQQIETVRR